MKINKLNLIFIFKNNFIKMLYTIKINFQFCINSTHHATHKNSVPG